MQSAAVWRALRDGWFTLRAINELNGRGRSSKFAGDHFAQQSARRDVMLAILFEMKTRGAFSFRFVE